jgi:tRNA A-37 threonylcarbamoyl transferase component Bud32
MHEAAPSGPLLEGRYQVRSVLGGGASAVVYLAQQSRVGRDVAIKIIRPEVFSNEKELERYLLEARIIASLNHPNIVTLYDVGRLPDERPYMVMEFVRGQSLNRTLRNDGYFPVDLAFQVFLQVAQALAHAHRNGVIHRDIKPGNILLEHRSTGLVRARVADFGIASVSTGHEGHEGSFIGTPMYMSPEQAQGLAVTPRSDIYSLGVVMYRLLTGERPFMADTPVALAMCHVTEPVKPFSEVAPLLDIPPELERVVMKCMAKRPRDRYADCQELIDDLKAVQVQILPHLLGLSQESLEPLLLSAEEQAAMRRAQGPNPKALAFVAGGMVALAVTFAAGVAAQAISTPKPAPEVVEVERVVEVPVLPPETVVELSSEPSAGPPSAGTSAARGGNAGHEAYGGPQAGPRAQGTSDDAAATSDTYGHAPHDGVAPMVGYGGIDAHWVGTADGRPLELDLSGSPDGQVAGKLRVKHGPTWSTRHLVGSVTGLSPHRVRVTLFDLEGRQATTLSVDVEHRRGRGSLNIGGKSREIAIEPR